MLLWCDKVDWRGGGTWLRNSVTVVARGGVVRGEHLQRKPGAGEMLR